METIINMKYLQARGVVLSGIILCCLNVRSVHAQFVHIYGYVDKTGQYTIAPTFDDARSFAEGLAAVKINGKWGFVERTGKLSIKRRFDWVEHFTEGLAAVEQNKKWGFIDRTGKYIIEPMYDNADWFSEGVARVQMGLNRMFINKTGQFIMKTTESESNSFARFSEARFSEGLALVKDVNTQYGYIDKNGKMVIS